MHNTNVLLNYVHFIGFIIVCVIILCLCTSVAKTLLSCYSMWMVSISRLCYLQNLLRRTRDSFIIFGVLQSLVLLMVCFFIGKICSRDY